LPYELFTTKAIRLGSPVLTISSDGRIALNADAGDLLPPGTKFVQILWDSKANKVALRPLIKPAESSYRIGFRRGKRGRHFSALAFLRYIGWDMSKSATIPIAWNEGENVFEASLPRDNITKGVDR